MFFLRVVSDHMQLRLFVFGDFEHLHLFGPFEHLAFNQVRHLQAQGNASAGAGAASSSHPSVPRAAGAAPGGGALFGRGRFGEQIATRMAAEDATANEEFNCCVFARK